MEKLGLENVLDYHYLLVVVLPNLLLLLALIYIDNVFAAFRWIYNLFTGDNKKDAKPPQTS